MADRGESGHPNRHDVALPSPAIVIPKRAMAVIYKFLSEFGMTLHPKCASKDCSEPNSNLDKH